MAKLYIVATPIGNLEDITVRALKVLEEAALIACEDTRHSAKLLKRYNISKKLLSCHSHNEEAVTDKIINLMQEGNDIAYLSDAGTPTISDPGSRLVKKTKTAGFAVIPLPGACAATTLLSVAGISFNRFTFHGFLPVKSGKREKTLLDLLARNEPILLYESPHRLLKLFNELQKLAPERDITIGRELTKIHEEIVNGSAAALIRQFASRAAIKGEITVIISHQDFND